MNIRMPFYNSMVPEKSIFLQAVNSYDLI